MGVSQTIQSEARVQAYGQETIWGKVIVPTDGQETIQSEGGVQANGLETIQSGAIVLVDSTVTVHH